MISLLSKIISYNFYREFGITHPLPANITVTVTDMCNFMCKTCNIGRLYLAHPEIAKNELTAEEYGKIFRNIGNVFWVTVTGGEPFFRKDLVEIVHNIYRESSPKFVTIATNGYLPKKIISDVEQILQDCKKMRLVVNISLDGIGKEHDEIRGMEGSFKRVLESYFALKQLDDRRLSIGINTVISKFNVGMLDGIYAFVKDELKPDSFIAEVAENRSNLHNENDDMRPLDYSAALRTLMLQGKNSKKLPPAVIRLARNVFYRALLSGKAHRCFSGFASACIMPKGDLWLSCVKNSSVGNLRDANYDFRSLWFSDKAESMRKEFKKPCNCMLANAHYTNFMCNPFRFLSA